MAAPINVNLRGITREQGVLLATVNCIARYLGLEVSRTLYGNSIRSIKERFYGHVREIGVERKPLNCIEGQYAPDIKPEVVAEKLAHKLLHLGVKFGEDSYIVRAVSKYDSIYSFAYSR